MLIHSLPAVVTRIKIWLPLGSGVGREMIVTGFPTSEMTTALCVAIVAVLEC